ncbi:CRTAC1 family protein [Litorisediminicola beolgyonensis]|uniref:CRTAC1 family protein n=1 Tax=Litorisediminicola beolgyonensis TaxID=1173614 RepID=A0ABW3ZFS6_9RHOB
MIRLALSAAILAAPAAADPVFTDRADGLPAPHVYDGGWEHFVGGGVAIFDCNGDTLPDLFAAGGETPAALFVNRTEAPGAPIRFGRGEADALTGVTGAYPLDIDGDGALDLAILRVGPNRLWRGLGDCSFEDATERWGLVSEDLWTTAFTATWEPEQDAPTLVFGNYVDRADPEGPFGACDTHRLYRPDMARYAAPEIIAPGYCSLSMLITDWRRSGAPELRISNDRHYYVSGGYEEMWRLDPLEPVPDWEHVSLWGMGIASADLTGDGLPEVMLTSMGDQLLQINRGDRFENAPYSIGTYAQRPHIGDDGRPATGWHAEFGDIDNDARLDLFIAKGNVDQMPSNAMADPNNLLMQNEDGTFRETSITAGVASTARARGAGLADLDGDGRLDLVVVNRRAPMEIWQNETPGTGHWLGLKLRMPGSNTHAVGAWVEVATESGTQTREVTVGGGHAGGQSLPLHIGLGAATQATITVRWPDGGESTHDIDRVDRIVRLTPPR